MAEQKPRKRTVHTGTVESTERLTPHMVRIVLGGKGLDRFDTDGHTDSYVKLFFPETQDLSTADLEHTLNHGPRAQWPTTRTYTVRHWDRRQRLLTLDFVTHGDTGLAGPWAEAARPGHTLHFTGPGGAYSPSPEADWHLLAGDESALPAIAAALEGLPRGATAHVYLEVAGPEEEQVLATGEGVHLHWLHRGSGVVGSALVPALRALAFPAGRVHAFVHGEANAVRDLRRLLRIEHALPKEWLSVSGYWRLGRDEDTWQSTKGEWTRGIEEEEQAALATTAG